MNSSVLVDVFQALKALDGYDPHTQGQEFIKAAVQLREVVYRHGVTFETVGRHLSIKDDAQDVQKPITIDWKDKARRCAAAPNDVLTDEEQAFVLSIVDRFRISPKQDRWLDSIYRRLRQHDIRKLANSTETTWRARNKRNTCRPTKRS